MKPALLALTLVLAAGSALADESRPGSISGRIYSGETLQPVATTFVTIATEAGLELGVTSTDEEGRFRLDGVPPGFHRMVAWHGAEGSRPLSEISVRPGEHVANVGFVVEARSLVRLRIETPSGREPEIERCVLEQPPAVVEAVRRASGSFDLRAGPGEWTLHVHVKGFRTHVETLELERYERRFLTIELTTGVSVLGRVLDEDGAPVAGAVVDRLRVDEPACEGATWITDESGRFDLAGGAPAPTRFRVSALGYRGLVARLDLTDSQFIRRQDFVLKRLPVGGAVTGRVVNAAGRGVGGVAVEARSTRETAAVRVVAAEDGSFRFDGLPDAPFGVSTIAADDADEPDTVVARPGGAPVTLVLRRRPTVRVRPRFPDGTSPDLWRARVFSRAVAAGVVGSATSTGADAAVLLPGKQAVTLHLEIPGFATPEPVPLEMDWGEARDVELRIDPAPRTATLAAWVLTRDDLPLEVPHFVDISEPGGLSRRVRTDAMGSVLLRRLPGGRYHLKVVRESRTDDPDVPSASVDLPDGGSTRAHLLADAAMVIESDGGDAGKPGPLLVGDGLIWAAGTRLESASTLADILEFFGDREIGVEFLRKGRAMSLRFPADLLARYRMVETLR